MLPEAEWDFDSTWTSLSEQEQHVRAFLLLSEQIFKMLGLRLLLFGINVHHRHCYINHSNWWKRFLLGLGFISSTLVCQCATRDHDAIMVKNKLISLGSLSLPSWAISQKSKATLKACATVSVTAWAWRRHNKVKWHIRVHEK